MIDVMQIMVGMVWLSFAIIVFTACSFCALIVYDTLEKVRRKK